MDLFDRIIMEAELSTEERNDLKASQFGLPEERKFPLTDAKHVRSAISYFHTCPENKKAQLAKRIKSAAKKFGVEINPDSSVMKY